MIKTILIDNEDTLRQELKIILDEECDFIEVISVENSVEEGRKSILKYSPDLIFLDIELADGTGFDLLKSIPTIDFKIIFMTASLKYAVQAIKKGAFDYLLKPIDVDELSVTLFRIKRTLKIPNRDIERDGARFSIPYQNGIVYLEINKIIRIEAQGSYCKIHTNDQAVYTVSSRLKSYERKLGIHTFFRCHHSHIINLSKVSRVINEMKIVAVMDDGSHIDISTRRKNEFYKSMKHYLN